MLLEFIKSGTYFASGAYFPGATLQMGLPAEWHFEVARTNHRLHIDGTYRHHEGTVSHPLRLEIEIDEAQAGRGRFHLNSYHTGRMDGIAASIGHECCFLGRGPESTDATVSMHVFQDADFIFNVSGLLVLDNNKSIAFGLNVVLNDPLLATSKVVSITKGRA